MKVAPLIWTHRHGIDIVLVKVSDTTKESDLPKITNRLLDKLLTCDGVAELDREDESAEWRTPLSLDEMPTLPQEAL